MVRWIGRPRPTPLTTVNIMVGGADADGQGAERERRESEPLPESAKRVAEVLPEILKPARPAGIAALFLHLRGTAEGQPRFS